MDVRQGAQSLEVDIASHEELDTVHYALNRRGRAASSRKERARWWTAANGIGAFLIRPEADVYPCVIVGVDAELAVRAVLWLAERTDPDHDSYAPCLRRSDDALYLTVREQLDHQAIVLAS